MLAEASQLVRIARGAQWSLDDVDLAGDVRVWPSVPAQQRAAICDLVAGFVVAEHAVAAHLAPFVPAASDPLERELLGLQEGDEARHAALFSRLAREVTGPGRARPAVQELFGVQLPLAAAALAEGTTDLAHAVGLYHLVLEGLVFSVGQDALLDRLDRAGLTGARDAVARVQRDERWHVGLGVRLGGVPPADAVVELALQAWGPQDATDERLAHLRRVHARRVREAAAQLVSASPPR